MENESVGGSVGFVGGTCHDDNDQSDSDDDDDDDDVEEYTNVVGHNHHHHNHQHHHHNELNCVDDGDIDVDERLQLYQPSLLEQQQQQQQQLKAQQKLKPQQQVQIQTKPKISASITIDHSQRQKRFTQQRSILKNSTERSSNQDEQELLEAKKQMILRRRRLFSHYRQYEQWRRRQFSYDPCYYRATPLPIGQQAAHNHNNNNTCNNTAIGGHGAFRRRRQYRRQYSCAEREDSRESRESSSLQRYKGESMIASDSFNVGSHNSFEQQQQRSQWLQQHPHIHQRQHQKQQQHQHRHEQSVLQQQTIDCYSPTGTRRSHIHMLHEERSASISERCTRSRINSAIFVSSEGRGFDSIEFLRRHGSQSVLCRKAHSAENITNNGRKKSFSDNKRSWHTDEHTDSDLNATQSRQGDCDGSAIELRECRPNNVTNCNNVCGTSESRTLSVLTAHTNCDHPSTSAAAAASMSITNVVVGSISLEAPPAHIKEELHNGGGSTTSIDVNSTNGAVIVHPPNSEKRQRPTNFAGISTKSSTSRESADTVEELVLAPTVTVATAAVVPEIVAVTRSRSLVRQRSSTASISPHRSPKPITLKNPRTKIAAALPMVSVSGPSPPQEKPLPQPTTGTEYL